MAKKKIKIQDLKVKSFAPKLSKEEQKTAKGGIIVIAPQNIVPIYQWTAVKTQYKGRINTSSDGDK